MYDLGDVGRLKLVTSTIYGLHRRLPYRFECPECELVTTVEKVGEFDCRKCGVRHRLRAS